MTLTTTPTNALTISVLGTIDFAGAANAEISAYDHASKRLFITSDVGVRIVDMTAPATPVLIGGGPVSLTGLGGISNNASSVAVKNGVVALSLINPDKSLPGEVIFLDAATGTYLNKVTVGANPDMVTFTPDGTKVLVANEGELAVNGTDAEGSVSIINLTGGVSSATVTTATFAAFNGQEAALRAEDVRITAGKTASQDLEPEYIAITPDGSKAYVTLQENNGIAILNIATGVFEDIVGLGLKDFSPLQADFSDQDGSNPALAELKPLQPVFGLYMPDAIAAYRAGGQNLFVIANEGDDRDDFLTPDETVRVGALDLDNAVFGANEATLQNVANLGRLTVFRADSDADGVNGAEKLVMLGGRSFSILDANGNMIFDSADVVERIIATLDTPFFDDGRSDNKGPEPEGIAIGTIGTRTYAFVGLERSNATLVFDITNPQSVTYSSIASNLGDISPEGLLFIPADSSPSGDDLLVVSNETSSSVTTYSLSTPIVFTLQLLHFADGEAGLLASSTAPLLAALVDGFDDDYANTIILAGGDNYLPGPFLAAATDPSVAAVTGRGDNDGAADIEIHNAIGVQASTIGNHEFDLGPTSFFNAVNDAQFPYLSANLDFSNEPARINGGINRYVETVGTGALEEASNLKGRVAPSAVITQGGEKIGLVGVTTQIIEAISSTGNVEVKGFAEGQERDDMAQLAALLQPVIDDLRSQGVNKIVLMAHLQQIINEQTLAPLLAGVDIILAAGSNTRLGDANDEAVAFPGHAANFANAYPIVKAGLDGAPTLIVNTDNEYTYLGRLVVDFDANGEIITNLLDTTVNGAYASTVDNVAEAWGLDPDEIDSMDDLESTAFAEGTKGDRVKDITDAVQSVISAKDGTIYGVTNVYLEGERNLVRNQETNLGNLSADANAAALDKALGAADGTFIVSLKNGGGIRSVIGAIDVVTGDKLPPAANAAVGKEAGEISLLDIENSLRFNNRLMAFDTTAQGLKTILEHGVAALGNQGRFPQIGGVSFAYDPDLPANNRITSIGLIDEDGNLLARLYENGAFAPHLPTRITVVTLNFLAGNAAGANTPGGDGYPIKANGENFRFLLNDGTLSAPVDEALNFTAAGVVPANALGEQQAFIEFLQANHATPETAYNEADTAIALDTRIQNLNARADTVLEGDVIQTAAGKQTINGGIGDDQISVGADNDTVFGGDGNDTIDGGTGKDRIYGDAGNDELLGGDDDDRIDGGVGDDSIDGGAGNDRINGGLGNGNDVLNGGSGNDDIQGGDGDDTLFGGDGNDQVSGGDGNDVFFADAGNDSYSGRAGVDTLDFSLVEGSATIDLGRGRASSATTGNDRVSSVENIVGTAFDDKLIGNRDANRFDGGQGDDTLCGGRGLDVLFGGEGEDTFLFVGTPNARDADEIVDFEIGVDIIALARRDFSKAGPVGELNADAFTIGEMATSLSHRIIFDDATGELFYDRDGSGRSAAIKFAVLEAGLDLTNSDFTIMA